MPIAWILARIAGSAIILAFGLDIAINVFNTSSAFMPVLAVLVFLASWIPLIFELVRLVHAVTLATKDPSN